MREQLSELLRMHDAPLDEQLAEATLVGPLDDERLFEDGLCDDTCIEQEPSEGNRAHHRARIIARRPPIW